VAEELRLEEGGAEAAAVDLDEGAPSAGRTLVDAPRDPALAGPGLALEEDGAVAAGDAIDRGPDLAHEGGVAPRAAVPGDWPPLARPGRGRGCAFEAGLLLGPSTTAARWSSSKRLGEEVLRAESAWPRRRSRCRVAGEHDDHHVLVVLAEAAEDGDAADVRELEVEEDEVGTLLLVGAEGAGAGGGA
jgi:hypothetical protein